MAFNAAARKSAYEDRQEPMNMKRMRGRGHRQGGGGGGGNGFRNQQNGIPLNRNHVFDSSGPEMRVRGTAQQLYDKYTQMARDAASGGDRVLGEAYYQHAEHYFRIISAINQAQGLPPPGQAGQQPQGGEFQRRDAAEGGEAQGEQREQPRQEGRQDNREHRPQNQQERRFEPRQRQEFQPRERNEQRGERQFRPAPVAETPIDISSALEAELQAAVAAPAGLGEQPVVQAELPIVPEARAIPIVAEAPPAPVEAAAEEAPAVAAPVRRPRGRPRTKPVAADVEKVSE